MNSSILPLRALAVTAFVLLHGTGCAWQEPARLPDPAPGKVPGNATTDAAAAAWRMIGAPYRYGGADPSGFDCSGLVSYAYAQAGIRTPRTAAAQYRASRPLGLDEARPGDLVFFRYSGRVSHVGIYLGDARFVHAPSTGKRVTIGNLDSRHYRQRFVRAGRLD